MYFITTNPGETRKVGKILAKEFLKKPFLKKAFVLGLEGDLGGGKTTFLQGFARGLGIGEKITSPTFVIMKRYRIENCKLKIENFYHIDCYRIKKNREILDLGFKGTISDSRNILAIEWAGKMKKILPKNTLFLKFDFVDEKTRKITINF